MLIKLIIRRYLYRWKFLAVVFAGMMLSSSTMSGSFMYFDSLRDIALDYELESRSSESLDVKISASEKPLMGEKYQFLTQSIDQELINPLKSYSLNSYFGIRTATFLPKDIDNLIDKDIEFPKGETSISTSLCDSKDQVSSGNILEFCKRFYFTFIEDVDAKNLLSIDKVFNQNPDSSEAQVSALINSEIAALFKISPGDVIKLETYWDEPDPSLNVLISGTYDVENNEFFNQFYEKNFIQKDSSFIFSNLLIDTEVQLNKLGNRFTSMNVDLFWISDINEEKINSGVTDQLKYILNNIPEDFSSKFDGFSFSTSITDVLLDFDKNLSRAAIPMKTILVLISVVVIFFVFSLVNLIVEDQKEEITFLSSRGASLRQIYLIFNIEFLLMAIIVSVIGPFLAYGTIKIAAYLPWLSAILGDNNVYVRINYISFIFSTLGGLVSLAAVIIPTYFFLSSRLKVSSVDEREEQSVIQRYYLDVGFLLIALLLMWQVSQSQSVFIQNLVGENLISNIVLLMPSFILLGAGIVLLRIFPLIVRGLSIFLSLRLISRFIPSWVILSLWHIGRSSNTYSRMSLLIILAAALGMFTASFKATLDKSLEDTIAYRVGSEYRIDGLQIPWNGPSYNLNDFSPTDNFISAFRSSERIKASVLGPSFTLLSIDSENLKNNSVFWRDDFYSDDIASIKSKIPPVNYEPIILDEKSDTLGLNVRFMFDPSRVNKHLGARGNPNLVIAAKLSDKNKRFYTAYFDATNCGLKMADNIRLAKSNDDVWCDITTALKPELLNPYIRTGRWTGITKKDDPRNKPFEPKFPISLHSIFITAPSTNLQSGAIDIHKIMSMKGSENYIEDGKEFLRYQIIKEHSINNNWKVLNTSSKSLADTLVFLENGKEFLRYQWTDGVTRQLRGFSIYNSEIPLKGVASESFRDVINAKIGDVVSITVMSNEFLVEIVDTISYFPTLYPDETPFLITNMNDILSGINVRKKQGDNQANEVWIQDLESMKSIRRDLDKNEIPFGSIYSNEGSLAAQKIDPLVFAGWQTLLLISFSTVALVSVVGFFIHSRVSFKKRNLEFATLKSIGISKSQIIILITIEQILVIGLALSLGIILGSRLSSTIMPYLVNIDSSSSLIPPMVNSVQWFDFSLVFGSIGILFLMIIIYTISSVFRISINETMRINLK